MKKLFFLVAVVSVVTLASFWVAPKMCTVICNLKLGSCSKEAPVFSAQKDIDALCGQICRYRLEVFQMIEGSESSQEAIHEKIDAIGALQISLEKKIADSILEAKRDMSEDKYKAYLKRLRAQLERSIRDNGFGEVLKGDQP
jgi:hypothetical protein